MHLDWNLVNTVFLFLITIIAGMAKSELHDIKRRVVRMENAFFRAGARALLDERNDVP